MMDAETQYHKVPKISMDYFFMNQDDEKASENLMLLMVDETGGNRYMRAVGRKGLGNNNEMDWLIKDLDEELKPRRYPGGDKEELIFKSDGERSIVAVREALAKYHGGKITPELSPKGESSSNGRVEEAGKTVRGLVKVLKDQMEFKTYMTIESSDVIMQWLVRWSAMLYSRYKTGADGKTAYQRQKGKPCRMEVIPFGEMVMYKKLK